MRVTLRTILLRALAVFAAVQATLVAVLLVLDHLRKRRSKLPLSYPAHSYAPVELELSDGTVKLFTNGVELYDAMLAEIEQAEHHIYLETFIWKDDAVGRSIRDALERKAGEGVTVCVIFDGFANMVVSSEFKDFPDSIHTLHFRPTNHPASIASPRNYFRDHRKILVVDDRVGFIGGYNLGSLYATDSWRDTHMRVTGDCVRELANAFADFWNNHRDTTLAPVPEVRGRAWKPDVLLHRNDPFLRIFPIRGMYLEAIDRAEKHVYMTHAYFVPDRAFRFAMIDAARRGVDVQVLVPWHSNHVVADWAARRYFSGLLEAGVRLFAYRDVMIHAKTATVDGMWSTVGTANIDRLSLLGNYEVNLEIYSTAVAAQMEDMFELDKTNCFELDLETWRNRPTRAKFAERVLEGLAPLV